MMIETSILKNYVRQLPIWRSCQYRLSEGVRPAYAVLATAEGSAPRVKGKSVQNSVVSEKMVLRKPKIDCRTTNFCMLRRRSPPPGFATLQNSKNRLDIAAQVQTLFAVVQRHKK